MKKIIFILCFLGLNIFHVMGQTPQSFQYQAVVRDASGTALVSQPVSFQISIISGSMTGTVEYVESHSALTNAYGIVTLFIGTGIPVSGMFSNISWGTNTYFVKVEADPTGGTSYLDMGTTQLLSVPYALYAETAGNAGQTYTAGTGISIAGNVITNDSPDQVVNINSGAGVQVSGTYPNFTIDNTSPDQTVNLTGTGSTTISGTYPNYTINSTDNNTTYTAGTGIDVTGTTITNTFPDQPVTLTQGGATTITGTYPNFTISSTDQNTGTPGGLNKTIQFNNAGVFGGDTSLVWDNTNKRLGLGSTTPSGRMVIQGSATAPDSVPLFEIKNSAGQQIMVVYNDSVHFYISDDGAKANRGGFAVSGRNNAKALTNHYLTVSPDSTRIYLNENISKDGFAIKGINSGGTRDYLNVSVDTTEIIDPSQPRILWYPTKEAFLAGRVLIESPDSVGTNSIAVGYETKAIGDFSQAFGYRARAFGSNATAIGNYANAFADNSFAFGDSAEASGAGAYALGSVSRDTSGTATGIPTTASGDYSIAIGLGALTQGKGAMAIGASNIATKSWAFAIGRESQATDYLAMAIGYQCKATANDGTCAIGYQSTASGTRSTAMGRGCIASSVGAVALGSGATASGNYSLAVGSSTASGWGAQALGSGSLASGYTSVALGINNTASDNNNVAVGYGNSATYVGTTALGINNTSTYQYATAVGYNNQAYHLYSTAVGYQNSTQMLYTVAVGAGNTANGFASVAIGNGNTTNGARSTVLGGEGNTANDSYETVLGRFSITGTGDQSNWITTDRLFTVGNGTATGSRSNALTLYKNGNLDLAGSITQENWMSPTMINNWTNFGAGYNVAGFFRDKNGIVHLRGLVRNGTAANAIMFTLPVGYRPVAIELQASFSASGACRIDIDANGNVWAYTNGSTVWTSLDGITFRANGY